VRFAQRLREARIERGLSQEELAARAGLHRTYVSSVERFERNITIDNMERLARAIDLEVVDLLTPT
jgi:transcriptional regulator with XRE-family HTH domain